MTGQPTLVFDNGRYQIRYRAGGRTRYKSTKTADPGEAAQALAQFAGGRAFASPRLADLLQSYRHEYVSQHTARSTRTGGLDGTLGRLSAFAGRRDAHEARAVADEWIAARKAAGIASGTIRKEVAALQAALRWAVRAGRLDAAAVPELDLPAKSPSRLRWLTEDEAERLTVAAARGRQGPRVREPVPRVEAFVRLALALGPRKRALETLKWSQVDLVAKLIDFRDGAETSKRRPRLPIPERVYGLLLELHEAKHSDYVLYRPGSITPAFTTARKRAGLGSDVTPHVLRHTFASWALQRGVPIWTVAQVLGDTVRTVEDVYGHLAADHLRDAVNF